MAEGTPDAGGVSSRRLGGATRRLFTGPRKAVGLLVSAAIPLVLAFYLPGILTSVSASPAIFATIVDPSAPPVTMIVPATRAAGTSPLKGCDTFRPWALSVGGVDAERTVFELVIQGNTDDPVYIAGMQPRLVSWSLATSGIVVQCPLGGSPDRYAIDLNLDSPAPARVTHGGDGAPFGYTVKRGESEVFTVEAHARRAKYDWVLLIDLVVAGRHRSLTIDDHGKPFATSPLPSDRLYEWTYDGNWSELVHGRPTGRILAGRALTVRLRGGRKRARILDPHVG